MPHRLLDIQKLRNTLRKDRMDLSHALDQYLKAAKIVRRNARTEPGSSSTKVISRMGTYLLQ